MTKEDAGLSENIETLQPEGGDEPNEVREVETTTGETQPLPDAAEANLKMVGQPEASKVSEQDKEDAPHRKSDEPKLVKGYFPKITNKPAVGEPQEISDADKPDTEIACEPEAKGDDSTPPLEHAGTQDAADDSETAEVDESSLKNLIVEPPSAEIKPGERVNFVVRAETEGGNQVKVANAGWVSQGGEIGEDGVYEAGSAAGSYTVTAKAGSLSASAKVSIIVPKPVWKVLEPEDKSDAVTHDVCEMWERDKAWRIVAASARGKLHAHKALWRDDSYAVGWVDDWTIVAVGDGAGSAKLSRIGSRVACDAAVASLKGLLDDFSIGRRGGDAPKDTDLQKLKSFLVQAASEARNEIVREAHDRECNLKDLSTTLLVAVHSAWKKKHLVASVQVGDGAIGVYEKGGECTVLGTADHGEFSSETVFLTSGSELVKKPLDQRVLFTLKPNVQCIGVMCDGVADDFFPEEKCLVQLFNGDPIEELRTLDGEPVRGVMQSVIPDPRDGEALQEWMKYEKKRSSDDRTLVLMYRR